MLLSLLPIAVGHALAVAVVVAVVVALGIVIDQETIRLAAGLLLIGWAFYHAVYGHRQRVRVGMQAGMTGLAVWSFLMATAHGAGLMLVPVVLIRSAWRRRRRGSSRQLGPSPCRSPRSACTPWPCSR